MTKLANPNEIREYFSSPRVRWVQTFESNNISDEIIFEFADRILKGDCISRCQSIVNMHRQYGRQMSKELFELITSKVSVFDLCQVQQVYNTLEVFTNLSSSELFINRTGVFLSIKYVPNVPLDFIERMYSLVLANSEKVLHSRQALHAHNELLPEVREFLIKTYKDNFNFSTAFATMLGRNELLDELFTPKELLENVPSGTVVKFFETGCGVFGQRGSPNVLDSIYNTPEIIEVLVHKMKAYSADESNPRLADSMWGNVQLLIKGHQDFDLIYNSVCDKVAALKNSVLDWGEISEHIMCNKLKDEELITVFSRLDAPLWFTDKFQSKMVQLTLKRVMDINSQDMAIESLMDACHKGFF